LASNQETPDFGLVGERVRVDVDKRTGALAFLESGGRVLTRERTDAPQTIERREISRAPTYEVENRFTLKPHEAIYGFGFTADDEVNRRNKQLLLVQTNVGTIIPVMMSSERYGILWDTYSMMRFQDDAAGARLGRRARRAALTITSWPGRRWTTWSPPTAG
jgi:alpha-D-xyloside xylohydrolase